ncbi:MAG: M15 family metallopeptidase [Cytophagales bacterium]|nr:M15 family metallopeptidase [Cytophagales bacterium]
MQRRKFINTISRLIPCLTLIPYIDIRLTTCLHSMPSLRGRTMSSIFFDPLELLGKIRPELYGDNYNLRAKASEAFTSMRSTALKDDIKIYSVSSYRSFEHQKGIWNRKYQKYIGRGMSPEKAINKIIEYSTIPGTSRHHWGTDLDIIDKSKPVPSDPLSAEHFKPGGLYEMLGEWLKKNAGKYGFYEVYTNDSTRKGFKYEPWHYSFKELSKPILEAFLEIDLKKYLIDEKIMGSEYFTDAFLGKYSDENILGINEELKGK